MEREEKKINTLGNKSFHFKPVCDVNFFCLFLFFLVELICCFVVVVFVFRMLVEANSRSGMLQSARDPYLWCFKGEVTFNILILPLKYSKYWNMLRVSRIMSLFFIDYILDSHIEIKQK